MHGVAKPLAQAERQRQGLFKPEDQCTSLSEVSMPEQLTKHPEVTLQVLRSAGATCSEGAKQEILVKCPASRFCKLPGGEICVYGVGEASQMTQISASDWRAMQVGLKMDMPALQTVPFGTFLIAIALSIAAGMLLSAGLAHYRHRRQLRRDRQP